MDHLKIHFTNKNWGLGSVIDLTKATDFVIAEAKVITLAVQLYSQQSNSVSI